MTNKLLSALFLTLFLISCTQLLDERQTSQNSYTGKDGCVYCHTNPARLKVLAPPQEGSGGAGGG